MNDQHENDPLIDHRQLDRLVDGELSADDRRRLIETLEQQPEKWRDCACAFLEAQEFGTACSDLVIGSELPRTLAATAEASQVHARAPAAAGARRSPRGWWAVLAACLLLGIAVGRSLDQGGSAALDKAPLLVGEDDVGNDRPRMPPTNALAEQTTPSNREQPFVGYGGRPSAVPMDIETILDHLGHRVERRHVYMPVLAEDGRQVVIPVEQVDFVPVGLETY